MSAGIEKIPGGFSVDGLELKNGKCGCTSVAPCCYSWSKVKKRDSTTLEFVAKTTGPETKDHYTWHYTVTKDGITVNVTVEDARDKEIYSGYIPPSAQEWTEKGWEIVEKGGDREDGVIWRCAACRWLYNEEREGKPFEELSADWKCPRCNVGKESFERI